MKVLLLGSIGVLAETSELQRQAYNKAFHKHGLDWYWSVANYCDLLKNPGGRKRLTSYANSNISEQLVESIHNSKEEFYRHALKGGLYPREGLVECLDYCRSNDIIVAQTLTLPFIAPVAIVNLMSSPDEYASGATNNACCPVLVGATSLTY